MANQWEPQYRTSAFEEGTLQHTLWVMLQHVEWPHTPQYTVYSASASAASTEYLTQVLIQGRNFGDPAFRYYGRGSTVRMSLLDAAYVAIVRLRHELPVLREPFFHFPARAADQEEPTYQVEGRQFLTPHLHLAGLVRSLDGYLRQASRELLEARQRICTLEDSIAPMVAQGFFSRELLYGEDAVLAPAEELPQPITRLQPRTRRPRMSVIGHRRRVTAIYTGAVVPTSPLQRLRHRLAGLEDIEPQSTHSSDAPESSGVAQRDYTD